jgi:hypothetical protein
MVLEGACSCCEWALAYTLGMSRCRGQRWPHRLYRCRRRRTSVCALWAPSCCARDGGCLRTRLMRRGVSWCQRRGGEFYSVVGVCFGGRTDVAAGWSGSGGSGAEVKKRREAVVTEAVGRAAGGVTCLLFDAHFNLLPFQLDKLTTHSHLTPTPTCN